MPERYDDVQLSKEQLQRRMEEARESISQTVDEIKDTVVHQYEQVKEKLDWHEQYKKRPVAWSLGAVGAGFLVGYGLAAMVKGNGRANGQENSYESPESDVRPLVSSARSQDESKSRPGIVQRVKASPAYNQVQREASSLRTRFVDELAKTAQEIVLPAAIGGIRQWLAGRLSTMSQSTPSQVTTPGKRSHV